METLNIDIADQRILRQDIVKYSNQESDEVFFCHTFNISYVELIVKG